MDNNTYFVLEYDEEKAFRTYDAAYDYDFEHNPEEHPWEEASFERCEAVIFELSWEELTPEQQNYIEENLCE